jgi:hypothetical protein
MTALQAVRDVLAGNPGIVARARAYIYPQIAPKSHPDRQPFVLYEKASGGPLVDLQGVTGDEQIGVRIQACAWTYTDARGLADAITAALDAASNPDCVLSSEREEMEPPGDGDETPLRVVDQQYQVYYSLRP